MTYEELKTQLQGTANTSIEEKDGYLYVNFDKDIETDNLLNTSKVIYDYEKELFKNKEKVNIVVRAKDLETEKLEAWFKMALQDEDLCDPVMCLNIFDLIKNYNTLSEKFFENKDVYINSIEQLLDVKLDLKEELLTVTTKLAIYFVSLIKNVNKIKYNFTDNLKKVENMYEIFLNLSDFFSLSNIVSQAKDFNMSDCIYVCDSMTYLMSILEKTTNGLDMMEMFLKGKNSDDNSTTE